MRNWFGGNVGQLRFDAMESYGLLEVIPSPRGIRVVLLYRTTSSYIVFLQTPYPLPDANAE